MSFGPDKLTKDHVRKALMINGLTKDDIAIIHKALIKYMTMDRLKTYHGYAVVSVNSKNNIEPSHAEYPGWYQEIFETRDQAEQRENELLDTVGGIFEVVEIAMILKRFHCMNSELTEDDVITVRKDLIKDIIIDLRKSLIKGRKIKGRKAELVETSVTRLYQILNEEIS